MVNPHPALVDSLVVRQIHECISAISHKDAANFRQTCRHFRCTSELPQHLNLECKRWPQRDALEGLARLLGARGKPRTLRLRLRILGVDDHYSYMPWRVPWPDADEAQEAGLEELPCRLAAVGRWLTELRLDMSSSSELDAGLLLCSLPHLRVLMLCLRTRDVVAEEDVDTFHAPPGAEAGISFELGVKMPSHHNFPMCVQDMSAAGGAAGAVRSSRLTHLTLWAPPPSYPFCLPLQHLDFSHCGALQQLTLRGPITRQEGARLTLPVGAQLVLDPDVPQNSATQWLRPAVACSFPWHECPVPQIRMYQDEHRGHRARVLRRMVRLFRCKLNNMLKPAGRWTSADCALALVRMFVGLGVQQQSSRWRCLLGIAADSVSTGAAAQRG